MSEKVAVKQEEENFRIEDARPEDVETIRGIVRANWLEIYPNKEYGITTENILDIDWFNPEGLEKRRMEISEVSGVVHNFVLKDEKDKVVGFCKISKHDDYGEVNAMYVMKEFQEKGLGKKLMQKAFEWLDDSQDIIPKGFPRGLPRVPCRKV